MSNSRNLKAIAVAVAAVGASLIGGCADMHQGGSSGAAFAKAPLKTEATLGNPASPKEIEAWNIDVRPDFQGLPAGHGSVAEGQKIWEAKCASCHGDFADSNAVFPPLVGAFQATDAEIKEGRVKGMGDPANGFPTAIERLSSLSTLFDYIHRAMPWTAPLSLSWNDTYALVAYMMNLANVVPSNFVLTRDNVEWVQNRLPSRNNMTTAHDMWPGNEFGDGTDKPDTANTRCTENCAPTPKVESFIPDYAEDAWGNLADQNRPWGPVKGQVTLSKAALAKMEAAKAAAADSPFKKVQAILGANGCLGCHSTGDNTLVGPGYAAIAKKVSGEAGAEAKLSNAILKGSSGVWGSMPMPPQNVSAGDAKLIATWIATGAKQ